MPKKNISAEQAIREAISNYSESAQEKRKKYDLLTNEVFKVTQRHDFDQSKLIDTMIKAANEFEVEESTVISIVTHVCAKITNIDQQVVNDLITHRNKEEFSNKTVFCKAIKYKNTTFLAGLLGSDFLENWTRTDLNDALKLLINDINQLTNTRTQDNSMEVMLELLDMLLEHRADVTYHDGHVIRSAVTAEKWDVVWKLVDRVPSTRNIYSSFLNVVLEKYVLGICENSEEINSQYIELLLSKGASPYLSVVKEREEYSLIEFVADHEEWDSVKIILNYMTLKETLIHEVGGISRTLYVSVLAQLINKYIATVTTHDIDLIKILIQKGADPYVRIGSERFSRPVIVWAAREGHWDLVGIVLGRMDEETNTDDKANLGFVLVRYYIKKHEDKELLEQLKLKGASPYIQNCFGQTPIEISAILHKEDLVNYFLTLIAHEGNANDRAHLGVVMQECYKSPNNEEADGIEEKSDNTTVYIPDIDHLWLMGANPYLENSEGMTAIRAIANSDNWREVSKCLEKTKEHNIPHNKFELGLILKRYCIYQLKQLSDKTTASSSRSSVALIHQLLDLGADVSWYKESPGYIASKLAIHLRDTDLLKKILEKVNPSSYISTRIGFDTLLDLIINIHSEEIVQRSTNAFDEEEENISEKPSIQHEMLLIFIKYGADCSSRIERLANNGSFSLIEFIVGSILRKNKEEYGGEEETKGEQTDTTATHDYQQPHKDTQKKQINSLFMKIGELLIKPNSGYKPYFYYLLVKLTSDYEVDINTINKQGETLLDLLVDAINANNLQFNSEIFTILKLLRDKRGEFTTDDRLNKWATVSQQDRLDKTKEGEDGNGENKGLQFRQLTPKSDNVGLMSHSYIEEDINALNRKYSLLIPSPLIAVTSVNCHTTASYGGCIGSRLYLQFFIREGLFLLLNNYLDTAVSTTSNMAKKTFTKLFHCNNDDRRRHIDPVTSFIKEKSFNQMYCKMIKKCISSSDIKEWRWLSHGMLGKRKTPEFEEKSLKGRCIQRPDTNYYSQPAVYNDIVEHVNKELITCLLLHIAKTSTKEILLDDSLRDRITCIAIEANLCKSTREGVNDWWALQLEKVRFKCKGNLTSHVSTQKDATTLRK